MQLHAFMYYYLTQIEESLGGVVANVLDYNIVVNEFKLQSLL